MKSWPGPTLKGSVFSPSLVESVNVAGGGAPPPPSSAGAKILKDASRRLSGSRPPLSTSGGAGAWPGHWRETRTSVSTRSSRMAKARRTSAESALQKSQSGFSPCPRASQPATRAEPHPPRRARHEDATAGHRPAAAPPRSSRTAPLSSSSASPASHSWRMSWKGCGRTEASMAASSARVAMAVRPSALANFSSSPPTSCHQLIATGIMARYRRDSLVSGLTALATENCTSSGVRSLISRVPWATPPDFLTACLSLSTSTRSSAAAAPSAARRPCSAAARACTLRPRASRALPCWREAAVSPRRSAEAESPMALPGMPAFMAHAARRVYAVAMVLTSSGGMPPEKGSPPLAMAASIAFP
mmetsp:Transcript_111255/g.314932  ORF Transcript_111255/g.314932 Transcript_111255/m.314932 type:complete len:359 (-) Transcript_111255:1293-2369(-)